MRWYSKRSRPFSNPIHSKTPRLTYPEYFIHIHRSRIHSRSKVAFPPPSPNSDRHSSNSLLEISPYFNTKYENIITLISMLHRFTTNSFDKDTFIFFIIVKYTRTTTNLTNLISTKCNMDDYIL